MNKEGKTELFEESTEYKAKLKDEILYLLRLKAMLKEVSNRYYSCSTHRSLYHHLMIDQRSIDAIEKETPYFDKLMKEIGLTDDSARDNPKYKVSVVTLKRLYGRIQSTSSASKRTLDFIAYFISDSKYDWDQLQERVEALTEELESVCLWEGSGSLRRDEHIRPTRNGTINKIYSLSLAEGDKLTLTFDNGHKLKLIYKGHNEYKVAATDSHVLRPGYTLVITRMRCHAQIIEREVYDKDGNLTEGYMSDRIKSIEFEASFEAELQRFVQS